MLDHLIDPVENVSALRLGEALDDECSALRPVLESCPISFRRPDVELVVGAVDVEEQRGAVDVQIRFAINAQLGDVAGAVRRSLEASLRGLPE